AGSGTTTRRRRGRAAGGGGITSRSCCWGCTAARARARAGSSAAASARRRTPRRPPCCCSPASSAPPHFDYHPYPMVISIVETIASLSNCSLNSLCAASNYCVLYPDNCDVNYMYSFDHGDIIEPLFSPCA
uniref:Uncharacterized protein n=1 Tax=Triticum urartu TaxID=4572 RepID=A0A8R7UEF8_TRIUA